MHVLVLLVAWGPMSRVLLGSGMGVVVFVMVFVIMMVVNLKQCVAHKNKINLKLRRLHFGSTLYGLINDQYG